MKKVKIQSKLPINLKEEDRFIFNVEASYSIKVPEVKIMKNVFVTNNGFVLKHFILNPKSGFNLISKKDHTVYFEYWKTCLEQNIVSKYGKSLQAIHLSDKLYFIIHSKWLNYSFWITEYLQRLIRVEKEFGLKNVVLIYPEEWDNIPYIRESLSAFEFEKFVLPAGNHLFVDKLVFPEVREVTASFFPDHIQLVRKRLISEAKERSQLTQFPQKIYLTRGKNVKRAIVNEDELQEYFIKKGFSIVSFEKLTIWDQIVYMNHADIVFTVHGAGFANVMFMRENTVALEFLEKDFAYYANPFPHWKLSNAVNVNYAYQLCTSSKTKNISYQKLSKTNAKDRIEHVDRNIIVDLVELEKNIILAENHFLTL